MSSTQAKMLGVLFVCTGNICRSPTADGIFRQLVSDNGLDEYFVIDSAGIYAHVDEAPDRRSAMVALQNGVDLSPLRGRQFSRQDFQDFDYIFAMDKGHYRHIEAMRPSVSKAEVHLFLDFPPVAGKTGQDVLDPYYGGEQGFHNVYSQIEAACERILDHLSKQVSTRVTT